MNKYFEEDDSIDVKCPNCGHEFRPTRIKGVQIFEQDDGSIVVRAHLIAGFGDDGLIDTFRLEPNEYYDEITENDNGEQVVIQKVRPAKWTEEAIFQELERRVDARANGNANRAIGITKAPTPARSRTRKNVLPSTRTHN